ncbi:helicase-related protein [Streptomyces niveus]|uniref:helicase-related protein n=1 Tax=Streptomyces niveus TaxID=193462 RepID=UPI0036B70F46
MTTHVPAADAAGEAETERYAVGALVHARGRDWVVQPESRPELLVLRPLGGTADDVAGILPALESVRHARFAPPSPDDIGDQAAARLLRSALRIGFRSSAGPFRSLAGISVDPRPYQLVPLLMALRQETVRLLIADDVGIGKTVESGLIAAELLAQGEARGLVVLCGPALAEQWRAELRGKFGIDAELVLASTIGRLTRSQMYGGSVFHPDRNYVVSTDFIKSPRHRDDFVKNAPDLVIVDEAHTCVSESGSGGKRQRQLRYELLRRLADDPARHLLLVTATPHSGKEEPFRNLLGLLDRKLESISLDRDAGRKELARYFVQRRRADIRDDFQDDAIFPSDRATLEVAYTLHEDYRKLVERVISYARETVRDSSGGLQQRIRWWSALALLRSLASSPLAAAQTLRTRAANLDAVTEEEADAIGRAAVMDAAGDETMESADAVPGALLNSPTGEDDPSPGTDDDDDLADTDADGREKSARRRLLAMARQAEALTGPKDAKLEQLTKTVKGLLKDGYQPIVFCRFIPTATYVADHLKAALNPKRGPRTHAVEAITGTLAPDQRITRIAALTAEDADGNPPPAKRVLVATDCLSEGVNLQDSFDAVVHYDLAWNPTRHEQREGRVDRFGQRTDVVRAVTLYGADNGIDGIVLDVLLRKHARIRKATGVSVPVPDESDNVMQAVLEGLLLRGEGIQGDQLTLDFGAGSGLNDQRDDLHAKWQSAADREKASRSRYAQHSVKKEEVAREVAEVRASLGSGQETREFTKAALLALRGQAGPLPGEPTGFSIGAEGLPLAVRDMFRTVLGPKHPNPVPFHDTPVAPRGEVALARTDPAVSALAQFVLDAALDPKMPAWERPARRCGVVRTKAVTKRTTLLLVRYRFRLSLPNRSGDILHQIAEDARVLAFRGGTGAAEWLSEEEAVELLSARAAGNTDPERAVEHARRIISGLDRIDDVLESRGAELAARLLESHRRVRGAVGAARRGLKVTPQDRPDVLGVYVYLPDTTEASDSAEAPATTTEGASR